MPGNSRDTIVMFDVDGVVVLPGTRSAPSPHAWNARLKADLGIDPGRLSALFFAPSADGSASPMERCSTGRADIVDTLQPILVELGYRGDVEDLLSYWFERDAYVDPRPLEAAGILRAHGWRCCLATSQEKRRARFLWEELRLRDHFDEMYCSADLGLSKKRPDFFRAVSEAETCPNPLYFDDRLDVVRCAAEAGWRSVHYTSVDSVRVHPVFARCFVGTESPGREER